MLEVMKEIMMAQFFYFTLLKIHSKALLKKSISMSALKWFKPETYEGETTQLQQR